PGVQERTGADQKRVWAGLRQAIERLLNLAFVVCLESLDRQPENSCRRFDIGLEFFGRLEIEVDEGRDCLECGSSWRKSPSRLAANAPDNIVTPVAFPPGRLKLATKPSLTGSSPVKKVIGIELVAAFAAATEGLFAKITVTRRLTK